MNESSHMAWSMRCAVGQIAPLHWSTDVGGRAFIIYLILSPVADGVG